MTCPWCGDDGSECGCLERAFCDKAGQAGHRECGWCFLHEKPRFVCGCYVPRVEPLRVCRECGRLCEDRLSKYGKGWCCWTLPSSSGIAVPKWMYDGGVGVDLDDLTDCAAFKQRPKYR